MNELEEIKKKLPLDRVWEWLFGAPPQRAGTRFVARCIFHDDHDPSLSINVEEGFFYCFGCHASGDIFTLTQKALGLSFSESAQELANRAGVTLKTIHQGTPVRKLYEHVEAYFDRAVNQFENLPDSHPAKREVSSRGLKQPHPFGFVPTGGFATNSKLDQDTGITHNGCEFMAGRLVLPLLVNDRIVGFNGRELDGITPRVKGKYVNSPTTRLFTKGGKLIGLDTKRTRREPVVVCEGQFDLLSLQECGVNAACMFGSALTDSHVAQILRVNPTPTIILGFDFDSAGFKAKKRSLKNVNVQAFGRVVSTVDPGGKDWGEIYQKHGGDKVRDLLSHTVPAIIGILTAYRAHAHTPQENTQAKLFGKEFLNSIHAGQEWFEWWEDPRNAPPQPQEKTPSIIKELSSHAILASILLQYHPEHHLKPVEEKTDVDRVLNTAIEQRSPKEEDRELYARLANTTPSILTLPGVTPEGVLKQFEKTVN